MTINHVFKVYAPTAGLTVDPDRGKPFGPRSEHEAAELVRSLRSSGHSAWLEIAAISISN